MRSIYNTCEYCMFIYILSYADSHLYLPLHDKITALCEGQTCTRTNRVGTLEVISSGSVPVLPTRQDYSAVRGADIHSHQYSQDTGGYIKRLCASAAHKMIFFALMGHTLRQTQFSHMKTPLYTMAKPTISYWQQPLLNCQKFTSV